jgi:ribosomal-protein-alanine N-acetyltransferase
LPGKDQFDVDELYLRSFTSPRALHPTDAAAVHAILQRSGSEPGLPQWSLAAVAESLTSHDGLALTDEQGLCAFILLQTLPGAREILHLATDPRVRRKGAMKLLMAQLVASRMGSEQLWLEVHEANISARRLYEKCGFQEVGRRTKYYVDGGTAVLYNLG